MRRIVVNFMILCLLWFGVIPTSMVNAGGSEPYVGQILWVPFSFVPRGWAKCDGQILPISQNTALFSLLGTTYGGDGKSTFALPDMQGRLLLHAGQGSGLSEYVQGESSGSATHTLAVNELPYHSHSVSVSTATGTDTSPANAYYAQPANGKQYGPDGSSSFASPAVVSSGGGLPHNNMMPYTTLNCIIALQGVYPARP